MGGPLEGIRVLEFSQILAAPYAGMHLSDLGADVVKVEPPGGEGMRLIGQVAPGESKTFHSVNRGKRAVTLDLQRPEAQALVHRVIPQFDVFIINSRPGVSKRLCIDYETLAALHPGLVYVDSTGFGNEGPSATRSGSDVVMQAYSGLMAGNGKLNEVGGPAPGAIAIGDMGTGLVMCIGICAALYRRSLTGQGELIETSLLNTALSLQSLTAMRMPLSDELLVKPMLEQLRAARERGASYEELIEIHQGQRMISVSFMTYYSGYPVRDGALVLGALTPANQAQMRRAMGLEGEDPQEHPDFNALDPEWQAKAEAFRERVRQLLLTKTADEWVALFDAQGAPVSKVNFGEEMADDPQVEAMRYMIDIEHPLTGPEQHVGPIMKMRGHVLGNGLPSPPVGAHTEEVFTSLGVGADEFAALRGQGVFG